MKLWYVIQACIFTWIAYICETSSDPRLHPSDAFVIIFAAGISFLVTRCVFTVHDLLLWLWGWWKLRLLLLRTKPSESPGEKLLVTKGSLGGKSLIGKKR